MKKQTAFTLVELMVVIAIVAILLGVAVPSYRYVTTSNRMSTEVNALLGDMQYARVEAIKAGQSVTVCPSRDGVNCTNTTAWHTGWIVFSDPDGDAVVDSSEPILRAQKGFSGNDTFQADNGIQAVTFNREGFAPGLQSTPTVTFTLHDQTSNLLWTRCLQLTLTGFLTTQTHDTLRSCT